MQKSNLIPTHFRRKSCQIDVHLDRTFCSLSFTIFKICTLLNLVRKSLLLRQKSGPPAWSDCYLVWTKTFFFTLSTSLQQKLNFLASPHNFSHFRKIDVSQYT
eukprot:UN06834